MQAQFVEDLRYIFRKGNEKIKDPECVKDILLANILINMFDNMANKKKMLKHNA